MAARNPSQPVDSKQRRLDPFFRQWRRPRPAAGESLTPAIGTELSGAAASNPFAAYSRGRFASPHSQHSRSSTEFSVGTSNQRSGNSTPAPSTGHVTPASGSRTANGSPLAEPNGSLPNSARQSPNAASVPLNGANIVNTPPRSQNPVLNWSQSRQASNPKAYDKGTSRSNDTSPSISGKQATSDVETFDGSGSARATKRRRLSPKPEHHGNPSVEPSSNSFTDEGPSQQLQREQASAQSIDSKLAVAQLMSSSSISEIGSATPTPPESPILPPEPEEENAQLAPEQTPLQSSGSRRRIRSSQSEEELDDEDILEEQPPLKPKSQLHNSSEDSESDLSSLEDLSTILQRTNASRSKVQDPPQQQSDGGKAKTRAQSKVSRSGLVKPNSSRGVGLPKYRFSMADLVAQSKKDLNVQAQAEADEEFLGSESETELDHRDDDGTRSTKIDNELLVKVIEKDGDEESDGRVDKILDAFSRTEILQTAVSWEFFEQSSELEAATQELPDFFAYTGGVGLFAPCFKDFALREQAWMIGLGPEILGRSQNWQLVSWLWQATTLEPREELAYSYIEALKASRESLLRWMTPARIQTLFESLGARTDALQMSQHIVPRQKPRNYEQLPTPPVLSRVLYALGQLAPHFSLATQIYALNVVLRICIDANTAADHRIQGNLSDCIASLVDAIPEEHASGALWLTRATVLSSVQSPILQHTLLRSIPASSSRLGTLRREIALGCFLEQTGTGQVGASDGLFADAFDRIIQCIKSSVHFLLEHPEFDYRALAARVAVLDVAVDGALQSHQMTSHGEEIVDEGPRSNVVLPPKRSDSTALHRAARHNAQIDRLLEPLESISRRIIDTGASHMARTEAKNVLERLITRLDCTVRSRPRPRRGPLTDSTDGIFTDWGRVKKRNSNTEIDRARGFLAKYLERSKADSPVATVY